jgi:hypothetical protein
MSLARTLAVSAVVVSGVLSGAGCSSSDAQMSASDAANLNGKHAEPMSAAQQKAMGDFRDNFNKLHPPTGGPGVPPPGAK